MTAICCFFLCAGALTAQTGTYSTTDLVTSNQTITIPSTAISVTFEAWGAGGAGGYVNQNAIVNLAGGGAAGVSADGGDAVDAAFLVIPVRGAGGPGNPILGDGGNPQYGLANGNSGYVYGGGGSSANASWNAHNGGPGANGVVRVTIVTSEPDVFVCGTSKVSDGNMAYETVDIDGVCWMRENLQNNVECTNTTGFSALGAGTYNAATGQYENLLGYTAFWTSDPTTSTNTANVSEMVYSCDVPSQAAKDKNNMYSVRCVKVN